MYFLHMILFTDNTFYCSLSFTEREKPQKRVRSKEHMEKFIKSSKSIFCANCDMICHVFSNSTIAPDSRLSQRTDEWSHWETLVYDKLGIKSIRLNNTTFRNKGEICPRRRENNGKDKEGDQKKKYLHKSDTDTDEEE